MLTFEVLKKRINELYRAHSVLESYQNNVLRNSPFVPEHELIIHQAQETCLIAARSLFQRVTPFTQRSYTFQDALQPLATSYDLITSEFFYDTRGVVDELLSVYEHYFLPLADQLHVSPLDKIRFYKMQFV